MGWDGQGRADQDVIGWDGMNKTEPDRVEQGRSRCDERSKQASTHARHQARTHQTNQPINKPTDSITRQDHIKPPLSKDQTVVEASRDIRFHFAELMMTSCEMIL